MMRFLRRAAGVAAVALSLAALTGTAFADSGNGNSANAPGQEKKADAAAPQAAPAATPAPAAQPAAQPQAQSTPPGQAKKQATPSGSQPSNGQAKQQAKASAATPGVKPSSTTSHWTSCSTGGTATAATCTGNGPKADSSKQYGNGKTAAQIAVSRGAPAGTVIKGPGNSQPHKVTACGKPSNKSGGVDVHAVKSYDASACATPAPATTAATVTPACGSTVSSQTTVVGVMHMNGKGLPVHLMTNPKSAHFQPKHGDQPVTQTATSVVSNGDSCGSTAPSVTPTGSTGQSGAILSASSAPTSSSSSAPASASGQVASAATPAAGGVLGATATLASPKKHAGGVLGTVANVAGSSLPFTGFPLWIAVLVAVALIAAGLMLRGRSTSARI